MKMTKEDFTKLKNLVNKVLDAHPEFLPYMAQKGYSDEQIRWKIFHEVWSLNPDLNPYGVYHYLNDEHIDTAMRKIMKERGYV